MASESAQRHAIKKLGELFAEFTALDRDDGIRNVYVDYDDWLRRQDWYKPAHPDYRE
jgi:hypothetical protein